MYHPIAPATRLYRITRLNEVWPGPLLGLGAYFTHGGRYNRPHQQVVYTSDDPLVAITEVAFYQALEWHKRIAFHHFLPVAYPLESKHRLWCFTIDPAPAVVDLLNLGVQHQFPHPLHLPLDPQPAVRRHAGAGRRHSRLHSPRGNSGPAARGAAGPICADTTGRHLSADPVRAVRHGPSNPPALSAPSRARGTVGPDGRVPGAAAPACSFLQQHPD
ncbi:MAG: RES family NAD+ phosphorylase [Planctomycetes bacterium]|nr:RES family NAD+ phosphorylase [Planctomycetota bacterium]